MGDMCKRWILCECWVQKGGSSSVACVQSWIIKDVMPTAVLLSCQIKGNLQHMQVSQLTNQHLRCCSDGLSIIL